jgi:5-methylcytosine-specific restriction endonuclease McrA
LFTSKERKAEYDKAYRAANKEHRAALAKAYRLANKEYFIEKDKAYHLANKERRSAQKKQYRLDNIEKHNEWDRQKSLKRKALKLNAPYDGWTNAEGYARDNFTCQICLEPVPMDLPVGEVFNPLYPNIDHIVGLSFGGSHLLENVRLTHRQCNIDRTDEQERLGL